MLTLIGLYACFYSFRFASSSTLTAPPLSALVVAFESVYDLSLLANTLSDQGIDTTLIIPTYTANNIYNKLIDVEVLQLDVNIDKSVSADKRALETCNIFFKDEEILNKVQKFQPTFIIFPALRHDGCLLPFAKHIESIPVIWIKNPDEELYAFECTRVALPVHSGGFWSRLSTSFSGRTIFSTVKNDYLTPALRLAIKHLPNINIDLEHLYSDVRLVLWGGDTVLRSDFASLTELLVEIGCHHCRGSYPLPENLQKSLIEYRTGTIVVLLEENYETLIQELAKKLPQGREGQAVIWKSKRNTNVAPENLFIDEDVDRQDIIGYSRTRVVLSHCTDTEFLEAAFHRTPLICLPRDAHESRNTARAVELGFARSIKITNDHFASAMEIAQIINEIYETVAYRENARKVSVAIRDRLNPSSDRLVYWLGYVARTKDDTEKFHKPKSQARTLTEDIQFFVGLLVGVIIGIVCASSAVVARYLITTNKVQITKGRYMQ
ncbi:PREDICTED: UDP-glucuronosyltransferase 1-2-like [Acromyrmex echinatior]|uniref:UDP-glucuronosyltransferase 1-2-like n=1 Tax=Acromyrmex echinatior TaxID=103372 RepID=UPI000580D78E|nr:PREDICTED: UDP-glucuronosyltransferase 1-2-like [Acromyrmex echinatior]